MQYYTHSEWHPVLGFTLTQFTEHSNDTEAILQTFHIFQNNIGNNCFANIAFGTKVFH